MDDAGWKHLTEIFPAVLRGASFVSEAAEVPSGQHQPPLIAGAFSPDGTMIALSGGGRIPSRPAIWIARVPSFETVAMIHGHQGVHDLAWDPVTGLLASASNDYGSVLWDVARKDHLFVCGVDGEPIVKGAVAFGDDVLYVGESEPFEGLAARLLRIDLKTADVAEVVELARGDEDTRFAIDHLVVDPRTDAWAIAVDDFDYSGKASILRGRGTNVGEKRAVKGTVRALGLRGSELLVETDPGDYDLEREVAFAPDGTLVHGTKNEIRTARWSTKLDAPADFKPTLFAFSHDGKRLAVAGVGLVALLDAATGHVLASVAPPAWFSPKAAGSGSRDSGG